MSNGPFHKRSTFHKDGALKQVKFGEGLPVLEVELNELQEIQNDRQQRLVRTLFSDGFITEPTILYRNGALEVSNADVVLGGEIIHISLLTIPLSNGEKVFLKAWEEEITYKDTIRKYGNQQEQTIQNKILDDRINRETTRRVQLKYDLVKEVKDGDTYIELGTLNGTNFVPSYPKSQLQAQGSLNDEEKTLIQNHLNNQTIHITQQERNAWNAKETPEGAQAKVDEHAKRTDNPHGVTKAQVGLGSVANYGVASQAEAETGTANNKYMTPLRTKQAIDVIAMGLLRDVGLSGPAKDISNSDLNTLNKTGFYQGNPLDNAPEGGNFRWYVIHIEATSQYALQIVSRVSALNMYYRIRTQTSTWSAWEKIETESGAQAKVNTVQSNLNSHINNKNNPHGVTKSQVGLGNVANYGIATQSEAEGGSVNDKYMTPLRTKQAIDRHAVRKSGDTIGGSITVQGGVKGKELIVSHPDNNEERFKIVYNNNGDLELWSYTADNQWELRAVLAHRNTQGRFLIGGKQVETTDGAQAKANAVQSNLNTHINDKNNPHGVTKSQVGLGSVQNYGIATQAEAEAGSVNNKYMTPLRTQQAINKHATSNAPHTYGGRFRWEYNPSTGTLDLVVL